MRVAVIVSTLGRSPEGLSRLLHSLAGQTYGTVEVVLADQSGGSAVREIAASWNDRIGVRVVTSSVGVSRGRNDCLESLAAEVELVAVTDDDCEYDPRAIEHAVEALSADTQLGGVCGVLASSLGLRVRQSTTELELDRRTVWTHAIEAAMFFRRSVLDEVGLYDESLGTGACTPWQSGEGTDLLLRALEAGHRFKYLPSIMVAEESPLTDPGAVKVKARRYARGTGRVFCMRYGWFARFKAVVGPLIKSVGYFAKGDRERASVSVAVSLGRLEGVAGVTVSGREFTAGRCN